jgi:co-chaperonin GroES (HSP10)
MVITTIGEEALGTSSRTSAPAGDGADAVDQRQQLGDVVAVPAGQADRKRDAVRVGDQVVL